jgi:hypothetical protein
MTTQIPPVESRFDDLTTSVVGGTGLFDKLMTAVKQHLLEEYNSQRLKGADWAKVYLGSMEATLANAVQYIASVGLLDAQLEKIKSDIELTNQQIENAKTEQRLTEANITLVEQNTKVAIQQEAEIKFKVEQLYPQQLLTEVAQTENITAQKDKTVYETANILPRDAANLDAQIQKSNKEVLLIDAKYQNELKNLQVLEEQIKLLKEQAAMYNKEANIKRAKIVADAWSAKAVSDGTGAGGPATYSDGNYLNQN